MKKIELIFIMVSLNFVLFSCKQSTEPPQIESQWENVTYNLEGQEIKTLKVYNSKLYASTISNIYILNDKSWEIVLDSAPNYIIDFGFRNDSLFILSYPSKILILNSNGELKEICNIDRSGLNSIVMFLSENNIYIGSYSQNPFRNGLAKINTKGNVIEYEMNNYVYSYNVSQIIEHNNKIFIGTYFTGHYLVGKLEDEKLENIGLNVRGACYSMTTIGDSILIGSNGEVLSYFNGVWNTYKSSIPTIPNTDLTDKAVSLLNYHGKIIVATKHNGLLEYNDENKVWESYFSKGLPESLNTNLLIENENQIFALLGIFDFSATKSKQIYRLNALNN